MKGNTPELTVSLKFLFIILRVLRLEVSVHNVQLQTSLKPLLLRGGGGGGKSLAEVNVNSKEENSLEFCPNYVQEFGLCMKETRLYALYSGSTRLLVIFSI
jgi:hypothetical protein